VTVAEFSVAGQVQISVASGPAVLVASDGSRGVNWYNIQFGGGGASSAAFKATGSMLRCRFINCSFYALADSDACLYLSGGTYAGLTFERCHANINAAGTRPTYGFYLAGAGTGSDNLFIGNTVLCGTTAAYYNALYNQSGTVVKDNVFIGGVNGIRDASSETDAAGNALYVGNYCFGTDSTAANAGGMEVTQNPTLRCIGNWCSDNGTGHWYVGTS